MRIVSIVIVICLLLTGCGRISNKSEAPNSKESPERIDQSEGDNYKLLFSATIPRLTEDGTGIDKLWLYDSTGISMPEKYNVAIPEEPEVETRKVSNDLKRILIIKGINNVAINNVYDIETEKIVFKKEVDTHIPKVHFFSPSLNKALYEDVEQNKVYLVNTITGEEILLSGVGNINIICNVIFSEDESKFAFVSGHVDEVKTICIYDLDSNTITSQIEIGKGNVYLSQWHGSNKILYNNEDSAYYLDIETSDIHVIDQYVFYPLLSPDGRYMAFSKPEEFIYYDTTTGMGFYSEEDRGLYIIDLTSNETEKITTDLHPDYIPFLWFTD